MAATPRKREWAWRQLPKPESGIWTGPRFRHTITYLEKGDHIALCGGKASLVSHATGDSDPAFLWLLDCAGTSCKPVTSIDGIVPTPRFAHRCILVNSELVLIGGVRSDGKTATCDVEILRIADGGDSCECVAMRTNAGYAGGLDDNKCAFYNFCAVYVNDTIVTLGGGGLCFSFGTVYSNAYGLRWETNEPLSNANAVLAFSKGLKSVKVALEERGWYDRARRIAKYDEQTFAVPITATSAGKIAKMSYRDIMTGEVSNDSFEHLFPVTADNGMVLTEAALPAAKHLLTQKKLSTKQQLLQLAATHAVAVGAWHAEGAPQKSLR